MNKADIVSRLAAEMRIPVKQATTIVESFMDSVMEALMKDSRLCLMGFGTFKISNRKARQGRNPRTGAEINIAAKKIPRFTPSKEFVDFING